MQQFASDNQAGMCPAALDALIAANAGGHMPSYGDDRYTQDLKARFADVFEKDCEAFLVSNGTAANALALAALCRPYEAILAHALSHIETDEAAAPEYFIGGGKIVSADTPAAKLTVAAVEQMATRWEGFHHVKARVLSLTQATELGTVYQVEEVATLCKAARTHGLTVHMDGARFANAVAHLACTPAELTWKSGVDVLSFGLTKNGLAAGEAIVFFEKALADGFAWRVKQAGQLASKMRLVSAPWLAMLENEVWLQNARHANAMAQALGKQLRAIPGVTILHPIEANAVFADIPVPVQAALRAKGWQFYTFLGTTGCRLMCAWDTAPETVEQFSSDLQSAARLA
ncbi:MAG: low specificity L-threonine aldolase [Hyphomicrobiaceae bacterium]